MQIYLIPDKTEISRMINLLGAKRLPNTVAAVRKSANFVQSEWVKNIKQSSIKKGWKEQYANAINIFHNNPELVYMSDNIYSEVSANTKNKFVNFAENGIKRFDMKPGLLNGPKSRPMHGGGRYNIIFMQKGTPTAQHIPTMPKEVYTKAKKLPFGQSLRGVKSLGMTSEEQTKMKKRGWKNSLYEGLTKTNKKNHTSYGTFRIITSNSTGWIYPGIKGHKIFSITARNVAPKVKEIIKQGLMMDVESGLDYLKAGK